MKIRRLFRILHRDSGYFIVGMTIVYALSGIYLNHRHDFNPDYKIFITDFETPVFDPGDANELTIKNILEKIDEHVVYKKHYVNNEGLVKVFIENGEVVIDPEKGTGRMHFLQRRPVIFEMNRLHKANIGATWKWVSDAMGVILIFVAVSGLVILKGKRGFGKWGWWLTLAGIIVPLLFVIVKM